MHEPTKRVAWLGLLEGFALVNGQWYRGSYSGWGEYRWFLGSAPKWSVLAKLHKVTGVSNLNYARVPRQ